MSLGREKWGFGHCALCPHLCRSAGQDKREPRRQADCYQGKEKQGPPTPDRRGEDRERGPTWGWDRPLPLTGLAAPSHAPGSAQTERPAGRRPAHTS